MDIKDFVLKYNVDFVSVSFVRKPEDVQKIREILGEEGAYIKVISKIENHEGLENYEEILSLSDGVMIMRKALSLEIPAEKIFVA